MKVRCGPRQKLFFTIMIIADVNECILSSNMCDVNAFCNNTFGGYTCQCLPGFRENGLNCGKLFYNIGW